jgi:hypothetical protein
MITKPIHLLPGSLHSTTDHICGLDTNGTVWYRKKPPAPPFASMGAAERRRRDEEEEEEARKPWRRFSEMGCVANDDKPASKDIPPEVIGKPVDLKPEHTPTSARYPWADPDDKAIDDYDRHLIHSFEE